MLRLIGLVVVVLLLLSVTHGERRLDDGGRADTSLEAAADRVFGLLAAGAECLDDLVFGAPGEPQAAPDVARMARQLAVWSRSADAASRRDLATVVLRACPSLNLVCQPAGDAPDRDGAGASRRFNGRGEMRQPPFEP